jgi:MtrB/PioB family decaheme-associated outer membrane protein
MKKLLTMNVKMAVLAGLTLPLLAWGQDGKPSEASQVQSELTLGVYYLDDDAYAFGKYSGLTEDGVEPLVDFRIDKRPQWDSDDTRRWSLQGWRLGHDSRRVEFKFSDQGKQWFKADYREIPNNRIGDGLTPYRGVGSDTLTLPSSWEVIPGSSDTSGFAALQESLVKVEIDTKRRWFDLSYDRKLSHTWDVAVDYRHETKKGTRTYGGMFGNWPEYGRAVILPAPVDYTTDNVEIMFNYATPEVQFGLGGFASFFSNDKASLLWQNAFGRDPGWAPSVHYPDSQGLLALEPDNSYVQFKAYGGANLTSSTRISADFSYGEMEQDEALLPWTVNNELVVPSPVPRVAADAKIEMTMFNFHLNTQLARRLSLAANYTYDDRNNKTPQALYAYVGADSEDQRGEQAGRINLPFSYRKHKGDAVATYRFAHGIRIKGGAEYADYSRDYSEVTDSNEVTWLAGIRFGGFQAAALNFDYRNSKRDVDAYVGNALYIASYQAGAVSEDSWQNHPLLRKYYLTDRDRDEFRFRADVFPLASLNFGFSASYFRDDYGDGFFGLNQAKVRSGTIDFGWNPAANMALTAYYTKEKYDASQTSLDFVNSVQAQDMDRVWFADSSDDVDTYNVSLAFSEIGKNRGWKGFNVGFDYTYSYTKSDIDVTAVTLPSAPLPGLTSKLRSVGAWGSIDIAANSSIRLSIENNKLDSADFALDNVLPDTLLNVLTLGETAPDYNVVLITGSFTYRF